jgi:ABC-type multidrug transport system ATPase subunit
MSNLLIKVENLSKRFNREWIFRNLHFDFEHGQTYAITGPNGSGKSTLLQILWGQMPPSKGTVTYFINQDKLPDDDIYRQVSVATPYMDLIEEFTLKEQLEFHFKTRPIRTGIFCCCHNAGYVP